MPSAGAKLRTQTGVSATPPSPQCDIGLKYKPRMGDALLFWSQKPDGSLDARALHAGCPVVAGEKWVATKWLRDRHVAPQKRG